MKICPHCTHKNREGYLFCEECGHNLQKVASTSTRQFTEILATQELTNQHISWGTARFDKTSVIMLRVHDSVAPILLPPAKRTILGRADISSTANPDLDLTPYGALEKGVSRVHAAIFQNEDTLTLVDMGSSNGTHLNGQRLIPDQPRILRDGDEIRLGKLILHIYFRSETVA